MTPRAKSITSDHTRRMVVLMAVAAVVVSVVLLVPWFAVAQPPARAMAPFYVLVLALMIILVAVGVLSYSTTKKLKETMEDLRRSEEKFRGIYEHALEGIYQVSLDGRLLSANPAMARLLGYDSPEELGADLTDIREKLYVHPEQRDIVLRTLLEQGRILARELEFYRKDKKTIWVSVNARVVHDTAGQPQYVEGIITDITERKRTEEESQKPFAGNRPTGPHDLDIR